MNSLLQTLLHITKLNEEEEAPANPVEAKPLDAEVPTPAAEAPKADAAAEPEIVEEYEDAGQFTQDFRSLETKLTEFSAVVSGGKFGHWIMETDKNFNVECAPLVEAVKEGAATLSASLKALEEELNKA